jgi:hypothetical protein
MYHSVTFGDKNTYDDWNLASTSMPIIQPPSVKSRSIGVPGKNGTLDVTEAITGYPLFENREGTLEFVMLDTSEDWTQKCTDISNYLHGQTLKLSLEDDPNWYYEGYFYVDELKSEEYFSTISIGYVLYPFKRLIEEFSLPLFASTEYADYDFPAILIGREPIIPKFEVQCTNDNGVHVKYYDKEKGTEKEVYLYNGTTETEDLMFYGNDLTLSLKCDYGYATVTITFLIGAI